MNSSTPTTRAIAFHGDDCYHQEHFGDLDKVIAGRKIIIEVAYIMLILWEKSDNYQLARSQCSSMIMTPLFGHEELSSQLWTSPYSTFLMKQHIINSSLLDFSDFPKWNPKFQTMMVKEFGLRNIFNSIQEFARASSGDNHVAEVLEITSGQAGSGQGGKSKISTRSKISLK